MNPLEPSNTSANGSEGSKEIPDPNSANETSTSEISDLPNNHTTQDYRLVWLNSNIDGINSDDCMNIVKKLRQIVNTISRFSDEDECIDSITDTKEEKTFLMISGTFCDTLIHTVQDIDQVSCICIFDRDTTGQEKWTKQSPKVKGIFTDVVQVCKTLKEAVKTYDQNLAPISFVNITDETSTPNLDELDRSFMYTQVLKEILLTIDFGQEHVNKFVTYCRELFVDNDAELQNVSKLEKEYHSYQPVWWYTSQYFLYSMLNRALRAMEIDLIVKLGFFLRDLDQDITALHSEQYGRENRSISFTVYRGQGLSQTDFDRLVNTKGGLISFNNFLSTSVDQEVSLAFAESNSYDNGSLGVLFEITINPHVSSIAFATIRDISAYQTEEEILFSMHSIFRIGQITQINGNNRVWMVSLILTSDNDPQLHLMTEYMRTETASDYKGWHRLGKLLIKLGHFNKAEQLYNVLLEQTINEVEEAHLYHMLGLVNDEQGQYPEAITFYKQSIEIKQRILSPHDLDFIVSYSNIGLVYGKMGEYTKALSCFEKVLKIGSSDHLDFVATYNNIALVYDKMGERAKTLSFFERALEIDRKTLPSNHPTLGISYNNIASMYFKMGEYSKAASFHD